MSKNAVISAIVCILTLTSNIHAEMTYFAHNGQLDTVALIGKGKRVGRGTTDNVSSMGDRKFGGAWNIEFSGIMDLEKAGKYAFVLSSDDGSALYIDDKEIIMNDGLHGNSSKRNTVSLPAGKHQVNLLYFNNNGNHALSATVGPENGKARDLASVCSPSKKKQDMGALRETAHKRQAAEGQQALIAMSSPEALVRSIKHILKKRPREYKNGREFLKQAQQFEKRMPEILEELVAGDPEAVQAMEEFGKLKYAALVAENPYVDFDEILIVLSDSFHNTNNWLGTHVINPMGHNNKIARLNLRTGQVTDIYESQDGAFVGGIGPAL